MGESISAFGVPLTCFLPHVPHSFFDLRVVKTKGDFVKISIFSIFLGLTVY